MSIIEASHRFALTPEEREAAEILREAHMLCARAYALYTIAEDLNAKAHRLRPKEDDDREWLRPSDSEVPFGDGA